MNDYLIAQTPLILGVFALLILAVYESRLSDRIGLGVSILAPLLSMYLVSRLPIGISYFGSSALISGAGKTIVILCLFLFLLCLILSRSYLEKVHSKASEWRLLVLTMSIGALNLSFANDLGTLFISFEIISIPAYALAGFTRGDKRSNEAGLKYFMLGAIGSVFFLSGISYLYGATGEYHLDRIALKLGALQASGGDNTFAKLSLGFFLISLLFKVGAAPFHVWLADVYQGSNLAALSIIAAPVKVAVYGLFALLMKSTFASFADIWQPILITAAILCFVIGGLQGIAQKNLKRILAYSSVVNAGFLLLAIAFAGPSMFAFYLLVYGWAVVSIVSYFAVFSSKAADVDEIGDLAQIGRDHPWLSFGLTVLFLSLSGIPLTGGFLAKLAIGLSVFRSEGFWIPYATMATVAGLILSVLPIYFYLKQVSALWMSRDETQPVQRELSWNFVLVAASGSAAIILFGFYPLSEFSL